MRYPDDENEQKFVIQSYRPVIQAEQTFSRVSLRNPKRDLEEKSKDCRFMKKLGCRGRRQWFLVLPSNR